MKWVFDWPFVMYQSAGFGWLVGNHYHDNEEVIIPHVDIGMHIYRHFLLEKNACPSFEDAESSEYSLFVYPVGKFSTWLVGQISRKASRPGWGLNPRPSASQPSDLDRSASEAGWPSSQLTLEIDFEKSELCIYTVKCLFTQCSVACTQYSQYSWPITSTTSMPIICLHLSV